MDHSEAVEQMLAEKYLLNELPPEMRDAFEEHMFDCPECAFDMRAGAAFVDEAKLQLPGLTMQAAGAPGAASSAPAELRAVSPMKKRSLFSWWRPMFASPVFAAPVFATLLLVVGYQNLVTFPAMRAASTEPHFASSLALHSGARGATHTAVEAGREQDVVLSIDVPLQNSYPSYTVDLYDPQGKLAWTRKVAASAVSSEDGTLWVTIPGAGLRQGSYALAVSGADSAGQSIEIERRTFDIHFRN
ncbi:MAG TPA: zf-HC2 domain-containing protein [Acidobacteriaceae bacterium]|nr:zf-HC2 domain-containing protein [Acidobacteriaceae bacterium]